MSICYVISKTVHILREREFGSIFKSKNVSYEYITQANTNIFASISMFTATL